MNEQKKFDPYRNLPEQCNKCAFYKLCNTAKLDYCDGDDFFPVNKLKEMEGK